MSKYRWKITRDHITPGRRGITVNGVLITTCDGAAVGTQGPRDADPNITSNPSHFAMYDDDGECYYEGMLYGEHDGFEPLDDYGRPNAGCSYIKIDGQIL